MHGQSSALTMTKLQVRRGAAPLVALLFSVFAASFSATEPVDPESIVTLQWDPGTTHEGTRVYTSETAEAGDFYFRITTANPSLGAWRTALRVEEGEAHLYLKRGAVPTATVADFKSELAGSDGFVLSSTQFAPNEVWYILVRVMANTSWSLVSGAPYVQDLGTVAADDTSSSGEVVIGPEGMRFFSTRAPTDMLAWRLWLEGGTNTILVRKTGVPLANRNELSQKGQALVVPPYLTGGQQYFIGIAGAPGSTNRLDSRQQAIVNVSYDSKATNSNSGFPYTTYRVQVPPQQIAWRISIPATEGNPNVTVRRSMVPNENYNEALSELAPPLTDNIALVPPVLSDGTFYITVWATNTHSFVLENGPAVVTEMNYIDTVINDDPERVGWRYYRVTDINQQLGSLGWHLSVANAAPGTRIALRRNAAPGIWNLRNPGASVANYHDLISVAQTLQDPGHQADVWYIGVFNPTNALGAFTLTTRELDPGPLIPPWVTSEFERTNVTPGVWEYFRLDLPPGPHPGIGWDLRLKNVTGVPMLVVRRDAFPDSLNNGFSLPVNGTNWSTRAAWAAAGDWTGRSMPNVGTTNENGRILAMGIGRPLEPGRYYVGVQSAAAHPAPISFTLSSRWVGNELEIPVRALEWSGANETNTVAPREAHYYALTLPEGLRSLKLRLRTISGEAMLVASRETMPNVSATLNNPIPNSAGKAVRKTGDEYLTILPPRGTNVLAAGTYYLAVIGEGENPPDNTRIGTGSSTYVLETLGQMPEPNLGLLGNELETTGVLAGGDVAAYHFNTEPGIMGFWIFLEDRIGNPVAVSSPEIDLADPGLASPGFGMDVYGNDGGEGSGAVAGTVISVSDPYPTETIMVKARQSSGSYPDASYRLRVKQIFPEALAFDGGLITKTGSDLERGDFFYVDVPQSALGWDLRLTNVVSGSPQLVVRRDYLATSLGTDLSAGTDTNWFPAAQWTATRDWTERSQSATGTPEDGRILAMGMGRPLEPGRYYIAVLGGGTASYTIVSRGIGEGMSIPVTPLSYQGGSASVSDLPPREAAYFSVDIPAGAPSWKVQLATLESEALLIASKGTLPNVAAAQSLNMTNSAGHKMQKTGDEYFLLLPPSGSDSVLPGRYYLTVVSEGVSPAGLRIGTNTSSFHLTSLGAAAVKQLGELGVTDLVETNQLAAGDTAIYQFTVPQGTLGLEARLEDRTGNPVMVLRNGPGTPPAGGGKSPVPAELYGNENGETPGFEAHPSLISVGHGTNAVYTLVVMARSMAGSFTNASYSLRLNASGTTTLAFDNEAFAVTDQGAKTWKYFRVVVPAEAMGWDVRLLDVTNGEPKLVIRRDSLPTTTQNTPWGAPGSATSWPSHAQWAPTMDWTRRNQSAGTPVVNEDGRVFACGMGRPLEPGTYYVGVFNNHTTAAAAYTILSRGIGEGYSIPLIDVPFVGSYSATLPPRDAAYFRVVVPSNAPGWKVKLTGDAGESMMVVLRDRLPNITMTQAAGTVANGKAMQKAGNEHFLLLPPTGQTNLPSSTNYFAVISEGLNPASATKIGSESSSFTFESEGPIVVRDLGLLTSEDIVRPDFVEAGESRAYQFLVPPGTLGMKVRLENREGNPTFVLRYGERIPDPGAPVPSPDAYGNEGGYTTTDGNALLYTLPNPLPGKYTMVVKGRPVTGAYPDASYTLRIQEVLVPEVNFAANMNENGLSNVATGVLDDNERVFYKFIIPSTNNGEEVIGWKLELTQSSGLASMRVRRDTLPADSTTSSQMQFATAAAIIVPPFLTNGVWYVEVKGAGSTAFRLTSSALALERPVWKMPAPGEPNEALGVLPPLFGDSGVDTNGVPLPGDSSTFLEQGTLHYYAVNVPPNNTGVLRAVLEAISGNPDAYLRQGAPPTLYHNLTGATGTIYDRSMLADATEYANWVPLDGKLEARLTPGIWYLAVRAASNANTRYRLKLSVGNMTDIPVHGPAVGNQLLAGGDWRYYRFTAPGTLPGGFNLVFSEQSGDVVVHVRDTVPPGNGTTGASAQYKDWVSDRKNSGPYESFNTPATYSLSAPPVRPGATYYFGVRALNDSSFTIRATTNGAVNTELPTIDFYGGNATLTLSPGAQILYRIEVPAEATRWKHSSSHAAGVLFFIEQGTLPIGGGTDDWRSPSSANTVLNQYLLGNWPWVPGQSYYLMISNTTDQAQDVVFAMDGRNVDTDDNDNDGIPDAWELRYFSNTGSQNSAGDPDQDGVFNYDEFLEGTDPTSAESFNARLFTAAQFGSILRTPDAATYPLNSTVTLLATPEPGYAFIRWTGDATGSQNPLVLSMDNHKTIGAMFKLAGDDFITALPLGGTSTDVTSSNVGMSKEPGEPNHAGNPGGKSIWWRWTAPGSGAVTLTTAGTPFNTLLAVYTGSDVANLTWIASDNASGGLTGRSLLQFNALAGTTYHIAVDGFNAASSRINLSLEMGGGSVGGTQPELTGLARHASGQTQLELFGDPGRSYTLETSTDLANWTVLGTITTDASGMGVFTDGTNTGERAFYRTRD